MKLLETYFISSWSLVATLEEAKANQSDEYAAKLATLCLEKYQFPVQMLLSFPNGTVIHEVNANDLLDESHEASVSVTELLNDPLVTIYTKFLTEGVNKAKRMGYFS